LTPPPECDTYRAIGKATHTGARNGRVPADADAVETLLDRKAVPVDVERFGDYLSEATVLVSGAGGSIGVELCGQLARLGADTLVLVDHAEAPLVGLARALRVEHGFDGAAPVLADVKSRARMFEVFERYRPDVVFHAAAYKDVPLLEACPVEGVATNVLGTKCVLDAARHVGTRHFVLFSTDKAVQPTNVLGQTKAVAEWIVAAAGRRMADRRFASVRLGNVVDSAGSILPMFRGQVARGGPITVTHPSATRYLITAAEAAGLAIVAGRFADSNSIFWLDSGPPVCVLDLARRLATAAPHDVGIEFVGLRAGERLHERLFSHGDEVAPTACEHIWTSPMHQVEPPWLEEWLAVLERHVERASSELVRAALAEIHAGPQREPVRPAEVVA
jgi:FlaA1/EpsC-like NDP-sugar epimerase